jgi:phosphoribosylamine--glycine ligase
MIFTADTVEKDVIPLLLKTSYVLKADGLAAGKGVLIIHDLAEAKEELRNMLVHQKLAQPVLK